MAYIDVDAVPSSNAGAGGWIVDQWGNDYAPPAGYHWVGLGQMRPDAPIDATDITVPDPGQASLQPGWYVLTFEPNVGKSGVVIWSYRESAVIHVPDGGRLVLENKAAAWAQQFRGLFGQFQVNDAGAYLGYHQMADPGNPNADYSDHFGEGATASLKASLKSGAALTGGWRVDKSDPKNWKMVWPTVQSPDLLAFATGGALNFQAIWLWINRWGPWILVALAILLIFLYAPGLILAFIKAVNQWHALIALLA